ncbi:hypothetical protein A2859_02705 [Candidatus Roizmanbacteria bacterium RIFCSPHIGHO2_01_FULL_37_16b]|nr:MAG: hypothetical protein A2859_02705 [Candidatus Roizmanbacteria bacterium RIFCSPHIGHO2_01_FULL_37_16b]
MSEAGNYRPIIRQTFQDFRNSDKSSKSLFTAQTRIWNQGRDGKIPIDTTRRAIVGLATMYLLIIRPREKLS